MKFVHLTEQPLISRIRISGIRCGNGRRGRGVYAVPLMQIPRIFYREDDPHLPADPMSSTKLWSWLAGTDWHRHLAAVVFRATPAQWPAKLYVEITKEVGTGWLQQVDSREVSVAESHLQFTRQAHADGFRSTLKLEVHSESGLGMVMHALHANGQTVWDDNNEGIEIVFPNPIPARAIVRVFPLYRSNKRFKQIERQRRLEE